MKIDCRDHSDISFGDDGGPCDFAINLHAVG